MFLSTYFAITKDTNTGVRQTPREQRGLFGFLTHQSFRFLEFHTIEKWEIFFPFVSTQRAREKERLNLDILYSDYQYLLRTEGFYFDFRSLRTVKSKY